MPPTATHTPTATATQTPTATATPGRLSVSPILSCVLDLGDGNYLAFFDYDNPNAFTVNIPIGTENYIQPDPQNHFQPTSFSPDRHFAFLTIFTTGNGVTWFLDGSTATGDSSSPPCVP